MHRCRQRGKAGAMEGYHTAPPRSAGDLADGGKQHVEFTACTLPPVSYTHLDISSYTAKEEMDYTTLYDQMEQGNVSAMAISETFYNMSKANIKDFEKNVQILKTYSKTDTIKTKEQKDITKQTFTVYLSGLDSTGSPDQQTRTDTNLLLIVNPVANHIDMVSIPRDAPVSYTHLQRP